MAGPGGSSGASIALFGVAASGGGVKEEELSAGGERASAGLLGEGSGREGSSVSPGVTGPGAEGREAETGSEDESG